MQAFEKISCTTDSEPIESFTVTCSPEDAFNWVEFWTTTAAVTSSLFTAAAVFIAWLAWRSALKNLALVREQIKEQKTSAKEAIQAQQKASQDSIQAQEKAAAEAIKAQQKLAQDALTAQKDDLEASLNAQEKAAESSIEAQRLLAVETRQVEFLVEYCSSLLPLGNGMTDVTVNFKEASLATTRAWMVWSMHLFVADPDFRGDTSTLNVYAHETAEAIQTQVRAARSNPEGDVSTLNTAIKTHQEFIGLYIGNLQVWQADPSQRERIAGEFKELAQKIEKNDR